MTVFGLPALTALFVFGGFLVAAGASIVFGVKFKPTSDRWMTVEDLFRRQSAPIESEDTTQRH